MISQELMKFGGAFVLLMLWLLANRGIRSIIDKKNERL